MLKLSPDEAIMNFNHQNRVAYTSTVYPTTIVYWTIDEHIISSTNAVAAYPTTICPSFVDSCSYEPYWVTIDLSEYCDGEVHELSAYKRDGDEFSLFSYNMSGGFGSRGEFGGKFSCTGGGNQDPNARKPVIFVPGIMGSLIRGDWNGEDSQFWVNINPNLTGQFPSIYNLTLDSSNQYYKEGLYASNVIESVLGQPVYKPLLDALKAKKFKLYDISRHVPPNDGCDLSQKSDDPAQNPSLFVFPYDWRQDNNQSADKLREYVQCVQQFYPPGTKINVIAHSMGGLVVRRYILQSQTRNEPHKLGKVITLATPYLGATEAIYKIYTGGSWEFPFSYVVVSPSNIKFLAPHMPSMHQLFPSRTFRELYGGIIEENGDVNGNGIPNENYSFSQIVSKLNSDFPGTTPGTVGAEFHDFDGQDDWRNDQSGIKYYHLVAEQNQWNTIVGLTVKKSIFCRVVGNTTLTDCHNGIRYTPEKGAGDKTVPTISASRAAGNTYLGAPDSDCYVYRSRSLSKTDEARAEHTGITQQLEIHNFVAYLLGADQQPPSDSPLLSQCSPQNVAARGAGDDKTKDNKKSVRTESGENLNYAGSVNYSPAYYLTITGTTKVTVRDNAGKTASIDGGLLNNQVSGLINYEVIGENSIMLTFSAGSIYGNIYMIEFNADDAPLGIDLAKGIGNSQPTWAVKYNDVNIPNGAKTKISLSADYSNFPFPSIDRITLQYDGNSSGGYNTTVSPTVELNGAGAGDTTPPTINIQTVQQGSSATATITAQDGESGVGKIWYSLNNGVNFQLYTSPFQIPSSSNPVIIEAFADDNAANRSGLYSKTVTFSQTQPTLAVKPVLECVAANPDGTFTAKFGYLNQNSVPVTISVGNNKFTPLPQDRGQTTEFQPGRIRFAFEVPFNGNNLVWTLKGPDNSGRTSTASRNSARCQ